MDSEEFRGNMKKIVELIVDYVRNPQKHDVLTGKQFGFVYNTFPKDMPGQPESFGDVLKDLQQIIMPGLLHWQHPRFHGFFA
jgi:aromatic-L-amino-acid decarboxylase